MTVYLTVALDVQIVCPCADIVLAGAAAFVVLCGFDGHSSLPSASMMVGCDSLIYRRLSIN
jgi:hypothetical protein